MQKLLQWRKGNEVIAKGQLKHFARRRVGGSPKDFLQRFCHTQDGLPIGGEPDPDGIGGGRCRRDT